MDFVTDSYKLVPYTGDKIPCTDGCEMWLICHHLLDSEGNINQDLVYRMNQIQSLGGGYSNGSYLFNLFQQCRNSNYKCMVAKETNTPKRTHRIVSRSGTTLATGSNFFEAYLNLVVGVLCSVFVIMIIVAILHGIGSLFK